MNHFLAIETTADACSIAWIAPDAVWSMQAPEPRSHARMLAPLIQSMMEERGQQPDAIALSAGPGSYTGLRIGAATAKGLCWSLKLPLFAVPTHTAMQLARASQTEAGGPGSTTSRLVLIGARADEVFSATFTGDALEPETAPALMLLDQALASSYEEVVVQDERMKARLMDAGCTLPVHVAPPLATHLAHALRNQPEAYRVQDVSLYEPEYMREFHARKPAKSIFDRLPF